MCQENKNCECLSNIIETIIKLQDFDEECCDLGGCDRPYLGPTPNIVCYNTRPVNFYNCSNGELWELPYTYDGTTGTSSIFRVESIDDCCVTCRILIPAEEPTDISPYTITNSYFTINLKCISAIKCLPDVYVQLCTQ